MSRREHPNKEIDAVVEEAVRSGWTLSISKKGHAWGQLFCEFKSRGGCILRVWSTPRNPEAFAKDLRRRIAKCSHDEI